MTLVIDQHILGEGQDKGRWVELWKYDFKMKDGKPSRDKVPLGGAVYLNPLYLNDRYFAALDTELAKIPESTGKEARKVLETKARARALVKTVITDWRDIATYATVKGKRVKRALKFCRRKMLDLLLGSPDINLCITTELNDLDKFTRANLAGEKKSGPTISNGGDEMEKGSPPPEKSPNAN